MKNIIIKTGLSLCLLAGWQQTMAQAPGSVETYNGLGIASGGTTTSVSESLYIGPGTYQIDGTWEVYSKNVWVSPDAVISGTGSIRFFNPATAGGAASATLMDGNNNSAFIGANMVLNNASGMILTDFPKPADATTWNDNTGNANLTTGKDFNFAVANANVFLGNYDMITATAATLSGYKPDRFAITAGTGHLVHNNYTGAFTFPVGIAAGDYTPAVINNIAPNSIHVMVQDTATSTAVETGLVSMGRTWNIYAATATTAGGSTVQLQHNTATDQTKFKEAAHYVTRWGSTTPNNTGDSAGGANAWQVNTPAPANLNPSNIQDPVAVIANTSMRQRIYGNSAGNAFATSATTTTAFFTKANEIPDLTPTLDIDNLSFAAAGTNRDFVVNLYNIGLANTDGSTIAFRINKLPSFTITYSTVSGTSNVYGGVANENSNWIFTENAGFITATAIAGTNIAKDGLAVIGFHISRNAGVASNTSQNITPTIVPGSGGEIKTNNNSVVTTVTAN